VLKLGAAGRRLARHVEREVVLVDADVGVVVGPVVGQRVLVFALARVLELDHAAGDAQADHEAQVDVVGGRQGVELVQLDALGQRELVGIVAREHPDALQNQVGSSEGAREDDARPLAVVGQQTKSDAQDHAEDHQDKLDQEMIPFAERIRRRKPRICRSEEL
jgi:hypothetical protein